MPTTMFPINLAALPFVATRKALLILDLQNDFVSPDGALPVEKPEAFVARILDLVKAFRESGAGDVIWIRTEFDRHCPIEPDGDQIIVSDIPVRKTPARGRRPASRAHDSAVLEADDEAFLSVSGLEEQPSCVRKDTPGAEFAPKVQEAVVEGRDTVFTKTHYSAFASGQQQLVQMLRGRFITEMYICGALTNVSIYATALDAGKHGHEMTIVEDCCGFRNELRHMSAIRQLTELTGCEVLKSEDIIAKLPPPKKKQAMAPPVKVAESPKEKPDPVTTSGDGLADKKASITPPIPHSTGLSPAISKISLNLSSPSSVTLSASLPPAVKPGCPKPSEDSAPQPQAELTAAARNESKTLSQSNDKPARPAVIDTPLEARDSGDTSGEDLDDGESLRAIQKRLQAARATRLSGSGRTGAPPRPPSRRSPASIKFNTDAEQTKTRMLPERPQKAASSEDTPPAKPKSPESPAKPSPSSGKTPRETSQKSPQSAASKAEHGKMDKTQGTPSPTVSEPLCEGDTHIITNVLPPVLADSAFDALLQEVSWAGMSHLGGEVPRRIAVQGEVDDKGNIPVYRHPSDESPPLLPFSPTVLAIKTAVEKHLGHPLNHVLIQHYRSGNDYISEHSDKTLDIVPNTFIANVSLGAERTMTFRTKRARKDDPPSSSSSSSSPSKPLPRQTHRAPLPHNSLLRMGLRTNTHYLHSIRPDKRPPTAKTPSELSHSTQRISLTFRRIGTFLTPSLTHIYGQGAVSKSPSSPRPVINGQTPSAIRLLQAFGAENNNPSFNWAEMYGAGFDVLHMGVPKRFCQGGERIGNLRVGIALAELGVGCAKGSVEGEVRFEDNDVGRATVEGEGTVLRYLDAVYGGGRRYDQMVPCEVGKRLGRLERGLELGGRWRGAKGDVEGGEKGGRGRLVGWARKELGEWEGWAKESVSTPAAAGGEKETSICAAGNEDEKSTQPDKEAAQVFIAGGTQPSPADFAFWPVLDDIVNECGEGVFPGDSLKQYYESFGKRSAVLKALAMMKKDKEVKGEEGREKEGGEGSG